MTVVTARAHARPLERLMHFTDVQKSEIKQAWAVRRRKQWVMAAACTPVIAAAISYQRGLTNTFFGLSPTVGAAVFVAMVVGAGAFSLRNWRCPGCSKYVGSDFSPRHCPHCMVQLR